MIMLVEGTVAAYQVTMVVVLFSANPPAFWCKGSGSCLKSHLDLTHRPPTRHHPLVVALCDLLHSDLITLACDSFLFQAWQYEGNLKPPSTERIRRPYPGLLEAIDEMIEAVLTPKHEVGQIS